MRKVSIASKDIMGQSQATPRNTLQRSQRRTSKRFQRTQKSPQGQAKTVVIELEKSVLRIEVPDDLLTCGWLLSEAIRKGGESIVALRTKANTEILDYWLTRMERSLQPLNDEESLCGVYAGTSACRAGFAAAVTISL